MAKKSAASAKVVKPKFEKKTPEENFQEWKEVELFTIDANIVQSKRIDTWVNMRSDWHDFTGLYPNSELVDELCAFTTETLEAVKAKIEALTFEQVTDEDYEDVFQDMIISPDECKGDLREYFKAWTRYGILKAWAPKVFDVRRALKNDGTAE